MVNSELEASFSGIGVQFNIQEDTVHIVAVISGGPSETAGLMAGDRIIEVDDSVFVGKEINNEKVMKRLRGPKGTEVKLGIKRHGTNETLHYNITRTDIPVKVVDAAYMITPEIGFIRISKFGEKTYKEFIASLAKLRAQGAIKYIIDLRENSGGYMEQAISMINEFLEEGDLIVYAEGKAYPRQDAKANGKGSFKNTPIVVLQDEFSASASEIFTGAIQDNDRGVIIGRRSFGKGLVQQQYPFQDGSAMRLTVARYYTPAGRCIQKPYNKGNDEEYMLDIVHRFERGEFYSKDSIHLVDSIPYYTKKGRVVYGGGGIMPDHFIPRDTSHNTPYYNIVVNYAYTYQFAYTYTDKNRETLNKYKTWQTMSQYLDQQNLLKEFIDFAENKGVKPVDAEIKKSEKALLRLIKAYITRNILDDEGFYPIFLQDDPMIEDAIKTLQNNLTE
jgi:carboxyl-terminal processing protease